MMNVFYVVAEALRREFDYEKFITLQKLIFFIEKIKNIVNVEKRWLNMV